MIDRIIVPPTVHMTMGTLVLVFTLISSVVAFWFAWRKQDFAPWTKGLFIGTQVVLMLQALIGIKLLDQGAGVLQLYIHYVGGLAPLLFFMLLYWFPISDAQKQRLAFGAAASAAFVFALMTFAIGQAFVRGTI